MSDYSNILDVLHHYDHYHEIYTTKTSDNFFGSSGASQSSPRVDQSHSPRVEGVVYRDLNGSHNNSVLKGPITIPITGPNRRNIAFDERSDEWSGSWYIVVKHVNGKPQDSKILTQVGNNAIEIPSVLVGNKILFEKSIRLFHNSLNHQNIRSIQYAILNDIDKRKNPYKILVISINDDGFEQNGEIIARSIEENFSTIHLLSWKSFGEVGVANAGRGMWFSNARHLLDAHSKVVFEIVLATGHENLQKWTRLEIK